MRRPKPLKRGLRRSPPLSRSIRPEARPGQGVLGSGGSSGFRTRQMYGLAAAELSFQVAVF
ncbi:MAG: hypothetical protein MI799_13185 [Desulfobacterales bacterium]|nr:hypothetical protein [Desulfobacterales bacterium]